MTNTPILDTLHEYLNKNPIRLHVPFHNGITNNSSLPKELYSLDISEVSGFDMDNYENPIYLSEKITASFFNTHHSFYLTGGASNGLLAAMIALRKFGEKVILSRNIHKSVINGAILAGFEILWLEVDFLPEWGIFSKINIDKLKEILNTTSGIAGCVIVSPTYEGVISHTDSIANLCHSYNIPLVLDQAHGAHLRFLNSSIINADLIIESWHKSLGSLTQTGILHLMNNVFFSYEDIKKCLGLISSTSPSFILLLSLELTRNHLMLTRGDFFKGLYKNIISFREELSKIKDIELFNSDDIFKIYIRHKILSGIDFAYHLYKDFHIEVESANEIGMLLMPGISFNSEISSSVLNSIKSYSKNINEVSRNDFSYINPKSKQIINPREAFFNGLNNKNLDYEFEVIAPCPPGWAIKIPGMEKIC